MRHLRLVTTTALEETKPVTIGLGADRSRNDHRLVQATENKHFKPLMTITRLKEGQRALSWPGLYQGQVHK